MGKYQCHSGAWRQLAPQQLLPPPPPELNTHIYSQPGMKPKPTKSSRMSLQVLQTVDSQQQHAPEVIDGQTETLRKQPLKSPRSAVAG